MKTVLLLICSTCFMTVAWYGHLKWLPKMSIAGTILISWMIALPEYIFQVPANRIGRFEEGFSAPQLKIIAEVISVTIFVLFSIFVLDETPKWNDWLAFALIIAAVVVMLAPRAMAAKNQPVAEQPAEVSPADVENGG